MVARLGQEHILHRHACSVLNPDSQARKSWFQAVCSLTIQYHLPHPLSLLDSPPSKSSWKAQVKRQVLSHWHTKLSAEVSLLSSLTHLKASHLSLSSPHLLVKTKVFCLRYQQYVTRKARYISIPKWNFHMSLPLLA